MRYLYFFALLAACNGRPIGAAASSAPLCHFDSGGSRPVLAQLTDHQLQLIHADGTSSVAYTFNRPQARNFFGQTVMTRGGRIAAAVNWVTSDSQDWNLDAVLLDAGGNLLWQGAGSGAGTQLFLNPHGALAISVGSGGLVVDAQGNARTLSLAPLAEPADDGSVLVRSGDTAFGWLRPGSDTLVPLSATLNDAGYAMMVAGRLAYLSTSGASTLLVSELPGDARSVLLDGLAPGTSAITDHLDSGEVLVGEWRTPHYLVNLQTMDARPIAMTLPADLRTFQGAISGPLLDSDASLLVGLRDDYSGALYRSTDGSSWQRLGGTVSGVLDIDPLVRSGTYLIGASSARYAEETWTPPIAGHQPDYVGDLVQVVRPESGVAQKLPLADGWVELPSLQLSDDGRCVAYADSQNLTAWDVERGRAFSLGAVGLVFGWIE